MTSTKENILEAAGRLIHLQGYHKTSVDDILRESGVGKGNLYYYFRSKDELAFASLDRTITLLRDRVLNRVFTSDGDPWNQLNEFIAFPLQESKTTECVGGCPLGNLAIEMSDVHEGFRSRLRLAFEEIGGRIEAALDRARSQGTLRPGTNIRRMTQFILAGLEGALMMGKLHRDPALLAGLVLELQSYLAQHRV